ncbi:MAG: DUF4254 domain-containing protein [Terracidiphilus sp.]|nr:DUF4254 domain-containing protein [Terracidiphilus sp.]
MVSAGEIVALQDRLTLLWHETAGEKYPSAPVNSVDAWLGLVTRQHRANFDLWHIEDEARAPRVSDAELAEVKRRIDKTNQLRNDLVEELDRNLLAWLEAHGLPKAGAPLNSESPGLIIDRLSILALKIYHTREETERRDAPEGHAERNLARLEVLREQRADLAACLDALWQDTMSGVRCFKLYRQMKMYNDPALNPAMYRKTGNEGTREQGSEAAREQGSKKLGSEEF